MTYTTTLTRTHEATLWVHVVGEVAQAEPEDLEGEAKERIAELVASNERLRKSLQKTLASRYDSNRRIAELEHDLNEKREIIRIACEETRMLREERDDALTRIAELEASQEEILMSRHVANERVAELEADMLAIARTLAIYHEADGHNDVPGDVSAIVAEIERLRVIEDRYRARQTVDNAQTVTLYHGKIEDMPERLTWPEPAEKKLDTISRRFDALQARYNATASELDAANKRVAELRAAEQERDLAREHARELEAMLQANPIMAAAGSDRESDRDAATITRLVARLAAAEVERDEANRRVADLKLALGDEAGWFDRYSAARAERDAALDRSRRAAQTLIAEFGADGPMNVDEAAELAVRVARERADGLAQAVTDATAEVVERVCAAVRVAEIRKAAKGNGNVDT